MTSPQPSVPPSLRPALSGLRFVCPRCKGRLGIAGDAYACMPCTRLYPLHEGIPDFRLEPDPYLGFADDHARTDRVLERLLDLSFPELLSYYWSLSEETPPTLRGKFIESAVRGEDRARRLLAVLEGAVIPAGTLSQKTVLELGSGTGNFLSASAGRAGRVVGVDVAMRWLHLSRRRLLDRGLPEPALVCASATHLPFEDGSFDAVVSLGTLEFVSDGSRLFAEAHRTLRPAGTFVLNTVNRFSLAAEPHVSLWGVGFLPRAKQARYVRWLRNASFEAVHLRSLGEIRRLAEGLFTSTEFLLPDIAPASLGTVPSHMRWKIEAYLRIRRSPILAPLLRRFVPEWDIRMRARKSSRAPT